ncbi:hypothetical protein Scani_33070 [Streptomyces caniferus]|uniref:Uncharacterized protein n=1 Tax=Streptomyces caniferus TaxID=285557 RepID=A0A640S727_9ACTN|nr:hypothetical protein Scani_33070 [Streptomyces caniferus]
MSARLLTHLRHVDLAVPDYDKQLDFYSGVWGLTKVAEDSGISFLVAEGFPEQYVVRLRKGDENLLDLVSYGAAHPADVDTLAERLLAGGVQLITQPGTVDTPGGGYGFRFFDIDGRTIEVSADVQARRHRKIEERESIPVKLSHVVLNSNDIHRTRTWYEKHLGFRLSDTLSSPHMGEVMHFMRISNQHHLMAIARAPTPHCTTSPSRCAASTSTCAAPAGHSVPDSPRCGAPAATWPATTPSRTSSTRMATPSNTRRSWSAWTRTPGTRTSTTSPSPRSPTSGAPPTR